jgi:hypothetical protein
MGFEGEGALVVEQVLPPSVGDELGDEHRHGVARVAVVEIFEVSMAS